MTRPFAVAQGVSEIALRTLAWHLRVSSSSINDSRQRESHQTELYVKPDDAWEMNDVADRCPQIIETLLEIQPTLCRSLCQPFSRQSAEALELPEETVRFP